MAKIITVGFNSPFRPLVDMSYIRWFSISRELSELGHDVDIASNEKTSFWNSGVTKLGPRLRKISLKKIRWENYDVVKTEYQRGFETLEAYGGLGHPCIIARMSGIVDSDDRDGIYFTEERRRWLYSMQLKIQKYASLISLTTEPAKQLWEERFQGNPEVLVVPGAAETFIPPPKKDPYPIDKKFRCLFAGNIFDRVSQRAVNEHLSNSLNTLGERLSKKGIGLFVIGSGDTSQLNSKFVTHLGTIPYADSWDFFYFASIGLALQWGHHPNQNELTKIYYYLRAGLPLVAQAGFPNEGLIKETEMGFVVPNGDLGELADRIEEVARSTHWPRVAASEWITRHHTWKNRAELYHQWLSEYNRPKVSPSKNLPLHPRFF